MLGDLNERAISLEEVVEAVNEMKSGKSPGLDGFPVECLKKGGTAVLEWLVRLLNLSFYLGVVPMDWRGACVVPLYKGKGDKCECSNSRRIGLLSVLRKLFGRGLIKRVRTGTECAIREEQCGFMQGRGCMDQVFVVRQVCEKYLVNGKDVFWAYHPQLAKAVIKVVQECQLCQEYKGRTINKFPLERWVAKYQYQVYAMDLMDLPKTKSGFVCVMVGIDRFSRYGHAVALKNKTSKIVAKALEGHVLSTVPSTPEVIFTDGGPEFKGREFNQVLARFYKVGQQTNSGPEI